MAHAQPGGMILVADPMRLTADLLCRRLRADGFEALAFATAAGVLGRLGPTGVRAVIVDPALAAGIVAKIRATLPKTPIIAFGTSDRPQDVASALAEGANAFLVKGRATPTQLVSRLNALLDGGPAKHATGEAAGAMDGSYYIHVDARSADAPRLAIDVGAGAGFKCSDCGGALALYLQRDIGRWGKWLFGTFGCLVCAKRRAPARRVVSLAAAQIEPLIEPIAVAAGGAR